MYYIHTTIISPSGHWRMCAGGRQMTPQLQHSRSSLMSSTAARDGEEEVAMEATLEATASGDEADISDEDRSWTGAEIFLSSSSNRCSSF